MLDVHRRGISAAMVIVFLSILALLIFSAAQVCIFHLQYSVAATTHQQLCDLAESSVNEALARTMANPSYANSTVHPRLTISGQQPGSQGILSFNPTDADVPTSLNNLASGNPTTASTGRIIPANTLYLVGRGKLGWQQATLEVLYYSPP
jgi:hypothetical protein